MSSSISIDLMKLLRKHICEPQNLHLLLLMVQKLVLLTRAYQLPGAYSEAAALKAYPKSETVPCEQFEAAFKALAQYEMKLSKLGIIRVSADDTAGAAQMVASSGKRDSGAVASP